MKISNDKNHDVRIDFEKENKYFRLPTRFLKSEGLNSDIEISTK